MTLLLILGGVMVLTALYLVYAATVPNADEARGVTRSLAVLEAMSNAPSELTKELDRPFAERVLEPLRARALVIGRRVTGAESAERIRRKLDLAGNPPGWSVDRVVSGKVLGAVAGLGGALILFSLLGAPYTVRIVLIAACGVAGFYAPNMMLYQKAHDREAQLGRDLPDAVDLLTICVESGLGFDAALQQVGRNTDGPLADEVTRMLSEMQIGSGRAEALRALATRTNQPDVRSFVSAMLQADAFGIPVGQVLRVQSGEMRIKRRQRAEEAAQKVPVKITVPLIVFILPCLFIAVMGPAVITIMADFV